ncbi:MAG: GNAT family N-acetyltransferase [Saprospiraceae bacterium]|nr:GNAT family N-acetyltransferase [Saprospiraceae bacterium]
MKALIRHIKTEDTAKLVDLCALHAEYEGATYSKIGKKEKLEAFFNEHAELVSGIVVEVDKVVVGYATYIKQLSTWDANTYIYMDCLFIEASFRGKGLGKQLMKWIIDDAKKLGCTIIQWQTPEENTRAIQFYQGLGAQSKSKQRFFLEL